MWTMPADSGLAASMYGPNTVTTTVKGGKRVRIEVTTDYPFEETVRMTVSLLPGGKEERPQVIGIPSNLMNFV